MDLKKGGGAIARTALFTAIIAVCAWLSLPMPSGISITLQTLGVCLAGAFLGARGGLISTAAYILLGVVGVPVFSGFAGGVGILLSPVGGYIVGFLFTALCVGAFSDRLKKSERERTVPIFLGSLLGILLCYAFGTVWYVLSFARTDKAVTFFSALTTCVLPYVLPDLFKAAMASALWQKLKKYR
ncbi:MAG: biotin transporter BioY [Clostridia bacterium]|nr:biotin transporter BioY [Clostridia bacterium]